MLAFETKTEEIKHYILEILADKQIHLRSEILQYVREKTSDAYSSTFISNCMSKLQKAGTVETVQRGAYILVESKETDQQDNSDPHNGVNQQDTLIENTEDSETSDSNSNSLTLEETNNENKQEDSLNQLIEISATKEEAQVGVSYPEPVLVPVTNLDKNCTDILERAIELLIAEARGIDILNLTDTDIKSVRGIKETIKQLEELKNNFK